MFYVKKVLILICSIFFSFKLFWLIFFLWLIIILLVFVLVLSNLSRIGVNNSIVEEWSLVTSLFCFFISIFFWISFDRFTSNFQQITLNNSYYQNSFVVFICPSLLGIDGISLFFILLTTCIVPLCLLNTIKEKLRDGSIFCLYLLVLEGLLLCTFGAMDLISFFVYFESILIPMLFIIGIWGSRDRKIKASIYFFLYTLFGSIFLLLFVIIIYYDIGTTNFIVLSNIFISYNKQKMLWFFSYIAFSVKIPTVPLHIWLPEAHVESPSSGSVILAGLLLKLGGYGFIRVTVLIVGGATNYFLPMIETFSALSIIYGSLISIQQLDLKRVVAYSSVAHMNSVVLGIFSSNIQGISGAIFLMIAHGIVSSGLFFIIGNLYVRLQTRLLPYYGGIVLVMPSLSLQLLFFSLANVGFPGTCNFIGELGLFAGLVDVNFFVLLLSMLSVIFSVLYTMFLFNRTIFGNLTKKIKVSKDLSHVEFLILLPLTILILLLGIFPDLLFDVILISVLKVVESSKYVIDVK